MEWLIPFLVPILACVAALGALYASSPQNKNLARLSAFLMILVAGWQCYAGFQAWQTQKTVEKYAYSRLETATRSILGLISQITLQATDGWLPTSDREFFSDRTARLVCRYLNLENNAPIAPKRNWLMFIHEKTKEAWDEYDAIVDIYGTMFDDELLESVIEFKKSFLLTFPPQRLGLWQLDVQAAYQRPPFLCHGVESMMQESLTQLNRLYDILWNKTGSNRYPMPQKSPQTARAIGSARFSDNDLKKWVAEHPYAPSGTPP